MKVEHVNPFVMSAVDVIRQVAGIEAQRGKLSLKAKVFPASEVNVLLGLSGGIRGQVIYSMSQATARAIASAMMMGQEVAELDELAMSALGELGNMITGTAAMQFDQDGIALDISTPTLCLGSNLSISATMNQILVVPLETPAGTIEINVGLHE